MTTDQQLDQTYQQALDILRQTATPAGFRASALSAGYPQIWARDSLITFLGIAATGEADLLATGRASLETASQHQSARGLIQLNVNPDSGYVSTENAGALDANLWYILGHYLHFELTHDADFLGQHWAGIQNAMRWLEYQDMNECGLLEVPEAGNWMDLIAVRYNVLYDNVLYYATSLAYQQLAGHFPGAYRPAIDPGGIHERLNLLMWIDRCWVAEHFAEHLERLKAMRLEWFMLYHNIGSISSRPFYLPWVAFREYGDWCDSLGNLLAILCGVADGHRTAHILHYMQQVGMADPCPTKAIHPPIYPGQADWRDYYRSRNLNLPHQYHNGGIWPMIGGFHVAALIRHGWPAEAEQLLHRLAAGNRQCIGPHQNFNEWLHGQTGQPMGFAQQAWSAAMFVYAYHAVESRHLPLFDRLLAAKPAAAVANENNDPFVRPGGGPVSPP